VKNLAVQVLSYYFFTIIEKSVLFRFDIFGVSLCTDFPKLASSKPSQASYACSKYKKRENKIK